VKSNTHILIAGVSSDRKAAGVIGKKLAQWMYHDKDLAGRCSNGIRLNHKWHRRWLLGFCQPDILALLGKMAHDRFVCIQTILGGIGVGDALEGVTVAGFDGIKPGLVDRKAKTGMIKFN